ncbi:hypothetical protein BU23DRAFT_166138 [Bimuria novae-zelandiae CBS 107.79]|uniref:SRR1-like domain-containing protein n=1 Tax=Bimuria novae-zelandiae CBS 107.79 TaxID=1447943 RepID=A0A6A5V7V2_9PLEO|nr:hypothetical protein BU23DRAFT_166138 [Bimuria novae-zelandiae CBS 107.79]
MHYTKTMSCRRSSGSGKLAPTLSMPSGSPRIDRVVCMGLGSFTRQTGSLEGLDPAHRPYFQHIVALSIAEALDDMYKQHSECYGHQSLPVRVIAQDPNYSESDKTVLAENGITVLDDPDGLLAIVKNTFVMSAFPSFPLYEIIADMLPGGPAAIFDASLPIDGHGDSTMAYNDFAAPRVRRMVALYRIHSFKWDEQELSDLNQKMHESMHWLSRMHLFFQPNLSGVDELSPIVVEDIQSREDLIKNMVPSGFQVLRQLFVRSIWG